GYNFPFLLSSIISRWGIQLGVLIVAIQIFNQSLTWIWLSYMFGDISESLILLYFYKKGKWKKKRAWQ
ncbi:MAG TPA: MATE family efflux transporter, partial [Petrotoga sp.]|nr:MATE family efflux transporter [Petrotoga sp.]